MHVLPKQRGLRFAAIGTAILTTTIGLYAAVSGDVFSRSNLFAYCIVPMDAAHRNAAERAAMLKKLGLQGEAIDWRKETVPHFDEEIATMRANHINIQAFWVRGDMYPQLHQPITPEGDVQIVLDTLERNHLETQIWAPFDADEKFMALPEDQRLATAVAAVRYVAEKAKRIHCTVAIQSHGGWMGDPENELKVLKAVNMDNVGLVYDFEHGRPQMDTFAQFFPKLVPHLYAVLIMGMKEGAPIPLNLGDGDRELGMLKVIRDSGYHGPVGIMNLRSNRDAEVAMHDNMEGLKKLLQQMGDTEALKTY